MSRSSISPDIPQLVSLKLLIVFLPINILNFVNLVFVNSANAIVSIFSIHFQRLQAIQFVRLLKVSVIFAVCYLLRQKLRVRYQIQWEILTRVMLLGIIYSLVDVHCLLNLLPFFPKSFNKFIERFLERFDQNNKNKSVDKTETESKSAQSAIDINITLDCVDVLCPSISILVQYLNMVHSVCVQ